MLESIHIQGFKGFKDTHIGPLRKVNLVVGGQNVGKTSLLEAVYLGGTDANLAPKVAIAFRTTEGYDQIRFLSKMRMRDVQVMRIRLQSASDTFFDTRIGEATNQQALIHPEYGGHDPVLSFQLDKELLGRWCVKNNLLYQVPPDEAFKSIRNPLPISLHLPSQDALNRLYGDLYGANKKDELVELLRQVEKRLKNVETVMSDGELRVTCSLSGEANARTLPQLGHGFSRLFYLYANLLATDSQLALIDEVENGIHYSALPVLMQGIKNVAKERDVQTIMTTHSWDCIKAASKVFEDSPQDFQVIRLVRTEDNIEADMIPGDFVQAVVDSDGEIR